MPDHYEFIVVGEGGRQITMNSWWLGKRVPYHYEFVVVGEGGCLITMNL